jgi:cobalamin biosynthesis Mg chelatase CobN
MPIGRTQTQTWLAHLEELIEEYRAAKRRRLLQRAIKLWRRAEADQRRAALEAQPERLH